MNSSQLGTEHPKVVEEFLLHQEGVLDASVWYDASGLRVQITVPQLSNLSERTVQSWCREGLGEEMTPGRVLIRTDRPRTALNRTAIRAA